VEVANGAQLNGGADFGPASDTLTYIFLAWAEAAHRGTVGRLDRERRGDGNLGLVTRRGKLVAEVLGGRADANIAFDDLRGLLLSLSFEERTKGSHHVFSKSGIEERINLQRDGRSAKPYQVKQVRAVILKYSLVGSEE